MISCCPYVLSLSPGDKPGGLLLCFRYGTVFCIRKVSRGKTFSLWNTIDTNLLNKGAWRDRCQRKLNLLFYFPIVPLHRDSGLRMTADIMPQNVLQEEYLVLSNLASKPGNSVEAAFPCFCATVNCLFSFWEKLDGCLSSQVFFLSVAVNSDKLYLSNSLSAWLLCPKLKDAWNEAKREGRIWKM